MKLLKKLLISILFAVTFITVIYPGTPPAHTQNQETVYVGSRKSNKYHHPYCVWAKKINPENLVTFESKTKAEEAGYIPCKVCRP